VLALKNLVYFCEHHEVAWLFSSCGGPFPLVWCAPGLVCARAALAVLLVLRRCRGVVILTHSASVVVGVQNAVIRMITVVPEVWLGSCPHVFLVLILVLFALYAMALPPMCGCLDRVVNHTFAVTLSPSPG